MKTQAEMLAVLMGKNLNRTELWKRFGGQTDDLLSGLIALGLVSRQFFRDREPMYAVAAMRRGWRQDKTLRRAA